MKYASTRFYWMRQLTSEKQVGNFHIFGQFGPVLVVKNVSLVFSYILTFSGNLLDCLCVTVVSAEMADVYTVHMYTQRQCASIEVVVLMASVMLTNTESR